MSKASVISVNKLSKTFIKNKVVQNSLREELMGMWGLGKRKNEEIFTALDQVSFDVKSGEVLGIIGSNGAGKSTLLKILSNITVPDSGEAIIHGRISSLLEVGTGFHRELSGRENIYLNGLILGMTRAEIKAQEEEIIEFSGIGSYIDTPIKHFSSGMGVRLAFAVAAHLNAEILLIDEVLAVGDAAFQSKCLNKMQNISNEGRTVIFVSHQLNVVQQLCTRCLLLENGKIKASGDSKEIVAAYLQDLSISNSFIPKEKSAIKKIKAFQKDQSITIEAQYECETSIKVPSLGFVIYDTFGMPITGSNPMLSGVHIADQLYPASGHIEIRVEEPKLVDGTYFISIWFGIDGYSDLEKFDKCLSIQIAGMSDNISKVDAQYLGSSASKCIYNFS